MKRMKKNNILLVDDDVNYLYLLSEILERKSIKTTKASKGIEAIGLLKKVNFDIIITDFNMPDMNGIELAATVKELHPHIPIIMVSAGMSPDVVEMAANAGISQILPKPINVARLLTAISHFSLRNG
jgi:CheY-like chemotaxis protein